MWEGRILAFGKPPSAHHCLSLGGDQVLPFPLVGRL